MLRGERRRCNLVLVKANVLWKEEKGRTYIASKTGIYVLNGKATFIWSLIGKIEEARIVELYKRKFKVKGGGEAKRFINTMKALGLVEVRDGSSTDRS
jgi:hypothetical protein